MSNKNIFPRPLTPAEKAGLLTLLFDGEVVSFGETGDEDFIYTLCALADMDYDTAKRAVLDANRFGMIHIREGGLDA